MSGRQSKAYRKILRPLAMKEAENLFASFEAHLQPKPWWVPAKLWGWGQRIFVKLEI